MTLLIDDGHPLRIGQEHADERHVPLDVGAQIAERVGMTTLKHRIGIRGQQGHGAATSDRDRMRHVPANGTRSQSGRCASSYSIS